jgi:hypothetical protein
MRKTGLFLVLLAMVATLTSCAGVEQTPLVDGRILVQYKDKDAIGPNHTGAILLPRPRPAEPKESIPAPKVIKLETTYSRVEDGWKQKCPSPKQRHSLYHNEVREVKTEEVFEPQIVTQQTEQPISLGFGAGAGPVEAILPAAFIAGGMIGAAHALPSNNINVSGGKGEANAAASSGSAAESH